MFDLLTILIGFNLTIALVVFAATSMAHKNVTINRIDKLAKDVLAKLGLVASDDLSANDIEDKQKTLSDVISESKPKFSSLSDGSLFLASAACFTFAAFFSQAVTSFIFRGLNLTVSNHFIYTSAFVAGIIYLVIAVSFLAIGHNWATMLSYVTLGKFRD